jgi:hypothetical protein
MGIDARSACGRIASPFFPERQAKAPAASYAQAPPGAARGFGHRRPNSVMPTSTRTSTSMLMPCGMNSGNMKLAMNSTVISGTPRDFDG